jgi:SAM-dependent methyltransferase
MNVRTFDRTRDVTKLVGCNTRNVEYRWTIFDRHLKRVPRGAAVLDFGAGSLRDTYELCSLGFAVTAFDLDLSVLESYADDYDWVARPEIVTGSDLALLKGRQFALITAFDVFEHLEDPSALLAQMREVMADGARVFCSVPNRRSLYEVVGRINWKIGLALGRTFTPGVPHLQFKSSTEWRAFFESCGFRIVDHEMAIGFFVNTWAALTDTPALLVRKLLRKLGVKTRPYKGSPLAGPRVMSALDSIDRRTRLHDLYGWNLFVLESLPAKPSMTTSGDAL